MYMKSFSLPGAAVCLASLLLAGPLFAGEVRELTWEELIPAGEPPQPQEPIYLVDEEDAFDEDDWDSKNFDDQYATPVYQAGVVAELNGTRAKLPGFVVPLEIAGEGRVKEFLLVPYFGACIHYPAPPANQIVYVKLDKAIAIESPWEPIWAIGTLSTETRESEYGPAGYTMAGESIEVYEY